MAPQMAYSGAWLRNAYVDPRAAFVPTADPAHDDLQDAPPGGEAFQAPPLTESAPIGEYPGAEWVANTLGTIIDRTDYDTHDAPSGAGAHAVDQGAAEQGYYSQYAPTQFTGERYVSEQFQSLPGQTVSDAALRRGMNSLPENNPEGFPVGDQQVNTFRVDRKFAVGERVHDRRVITPNTADQVTNVPPAPAQNGLYARSFDSLARAMPNVWQRPEIRREPPSASDDLQQDGAGQSQPLYPALSPWVVVT
jgi:hypothetical protein